MSAATQRGFLVLADISGYTSFVAGTELEHSHEILTELLELLVGGLTPVLTLVKQLVSTLARYKTPEQYETLARCLAAEQEAGE